jgi:hypothetical protein
MKNIGDEIMIKISASKKLKILLSTEETGV